MTASGPAPILRDMPAAAVPPAVRCSGCGFTWNSPALAEGLRLLAGCPRCGGALSFRDAPAPAAATSPAEEATDPASAGQAPHLVLGIPRRDA